MVQCKNCGHFFEGKYCSNCGQAADTHKLNFQFLWHDIQHGLFHFDSGVYYTLKQLCTRPGHSIREFIEGKRVKHFRPISLVIVLATVYGLLYHSFDMNVFAGRTSGPGLGTDINGWYAMHFSWFTLATIPIYTLGTFICFRHQGYNYFEYFILNSFKASQRLFFHIISFPLIYHFNGTEHLKTVINILYAVDIILLYWTNLQFFNKLSKFKALLLTIGSHLIFLIVFFIIAVLVVYMLGLVK